MRKLFATLTTVVLFTITATHNGMAHAGKPAKTPVAIKKASPAAPLNICEAIDKLAKKIKNYKKLKLGSDYDFEEIENFKTPYFRPSPFGSDQYSITYIPKIEDRDELMALFKQYEGILSQCKGLKFEESSEDQVSKNKRYAYSKKISITLKADTYYRELVIYVLIQHD